MRKEIIRSLIIWILLGCVCAAGIILTGSAFFIAAAVFLVLLPALSALFAYFAAKGISARVMLPATAEKGQELSGTAVLKNTGRLPAGRVLVCLDAENELTGEKAELDIMMTAAAGTETERPFVLSSERCGYIRAAAEKVYVFDWFGLIPVKAKGERTEATVSVLPETFVPDIHIEIPPAYVDDAEVWSQVKKGNDITEVFAMREYVPGDKLSQIHWKLSGKRNELIVKTRIPERHLRRKRTPWRRPYRRWLRGWLRRRSSSRWAGPTAGLFPPSR